MPPAPYPCRFGSYVLLEPLATGGMGHVALAMFGEAGSEQLCVVKRMLPHLLVKEDAVRRFEDEANLSRRLSHGCIVQTLATGRAEGEPFIAQALVDGRDLAELVSRVATQQVKVPLPLWIHLVREVCRGLAYAHDFENLGLVHRDISPQNIRLTFSGEVKLMDFGLAFSRDKKALTAPGAMLGRAAYMPPEQLAGEPTDRRADLYALGVVLWELVSGQLFGTVMQDGKPVYASDPRAALARAFKPNPVAPSTFNPEVTPELDEIVLRAVSPNRDDRYGSAAELRATLAPFIPTGFDGEARVGELLRSLFPRTAELERRRQLIDSGRALIGRAPPKSTAERVSATQPVAPPRVRSWRGPAIGAAIVAAGVLALVLVLSSRDRGLPPAPPPPTPVVAAPEPAAQPPPPPSVPPTPAPAPAPEPAAPAVQARRPPPSPKPTPAPPASEAPSAAKLLDSAREAFLNGDLKAALRDAQAAHRQGAGADALLVIGNVHFSQRRYKEAEDAYAAAARLAPGNRKVAERLEAVREMLHPR
ncbi:MAG: serine/threonine-protein kinase [Kofleriaceae bacterium]|nr:serine/threonine-protein kinase [Kofleriaceae bacterium]